MCGDVVNDILVEVPGPLTYGDDNPAAIRTRPGGSAANQAAWMARLGLDVVFAGRAGAADADFHRRELARFGVEPHLAADESATTGSIVVLVGPDGERTMITDRGANLRLRPGDAPAALLDGVALLHLTGYSFFAAGPREVALGLIAQARRDGVPFTVDPSSAAFLARQPPGAFLAWTEGAAICFPNRDEAAALTGTPVTVALGGSPAAEVSSGHDEPAGPPHRASSGHDKPAEPTGPAHPASTAHDDPARRAPPADPLAMAAELARHYGAVALKLGSEGAVLATPNAPPVKVPALKATVRDTTGAGDAFCAGFLAAWLTGATGATPLSATGAGLRAGLRAAALAVSCLGGRPDQEEIVTERGIRLLAYDKR